MLHNSSKHDQPGGFCCQRCPVTASVAAAHKVMLLVYENSLWFCVGPWAFQLVHLKGSLWPWTQIKSEGPVHWEMLLFWHFIVFCSVIEVGKYSYFLCNKSWEILVGNIIVPFFFLTLFIQCLGLFYIPTVEIFWLINSEKICCFVAFGFELFHYFLIAVISW